MSKTEERTTPQSAGSDVHPELLEQYGCGPVRFSGANEGLYERHLLFDDVVAPSAAGARERVKAVARSLMDFL